MALWVRSRRYADRMVRVGRLSVVFRGEYADLPDWAVREYAWMITCLPGVTPSQAPAAVFGVEEGSAHATPAEAAPAAPAAEQAPAPVETEAPRAASPARAAGGREP